MSFILSYLSIPLIFHSYLLPFSFIHDLFIFLCSYTLVTFFRPYPHFFIIRSFLSFFHFTSFSFHSLPIVPSFETSFINVVRHFLFFLSSLLLNLSLFHLISFRFFFLFLSSFLPSIICLLRFSSLFVFLSGFR